MPLLFSPFTRRDLVKAHPTWLFVFGDNLGQYGLGGQAAEIRGEPNAVGLPTKHIPAMREDAFFSNLDLPLVKVNTMPKFTLLREALAINRFVIWPLDGIGTGLAQLEVRAPEVAAFYRGQLERLKLDSKNTFQPRSR